MKKVAEILITQILRIRLVNKMVLRLIERNWRRNAYKFSKEREQSRKSNVSPRIIFGPVPIINNKYWSEALKQKNYDSKTLMESVYVINEKKDFDLYHNEIVKKHLHGIPAFIKNIFPQHVIFDYLLKSADILVLPFSGSINKNINDEADFFKRYGVKTIAVPYGSDFWIYSRIIDNSYKFGLMTNYPESGSNEETVLNQVNYWSKYADCLIVGGSFDGAPRWDLFSYSTLCIDLEKWKPAHQTRNADGVNHEVKIVHTPNHRYVKGTEFLLDAVEKLRSEGLKIELILLEKIPNEYVKTILCEQADILVEKLTHSVYGLSGVEGMAAGVVVISNIENEIATRPFRRYSYLNECPIVSGTPENIYDYLKVLVTNPSLRNQLGILGRKYVEKYHSYEAFQFMFSKIFDKIWYNREVDLMNLYHPLNPNSYNNQSPKIEHPLFENKIPEHYFKK